jgi:hypothetical protein
MRSILVLILIAIIKINSIAQTTAEWFPADLNIQPFTANFLEPKTGFQYLFDLENVRIDIGTSHDIIHWKNAEETFSFGADFFTYTRARSENNFKFPVETIDYLFGINASYKKYFSTKGGNDWEWGIRIRLSHISAHLVDGRYQSNTEDWIDGREPFVYSREFIELFPFISNLGLENSLVRMYAGVTYNFHLIPKDIKKVNLHYGNEFYLGIFSIWDIIPFIAYDFKLAGTDKYVGNNIISAGIKFGHPKSRGFSILASYFSGKSVHGEFYNFNESYVTIGINLDI